jgi:hypothetical protein
VGDAHLRGAQRTGRRRGEALTVFSSGIILLEALPALGTRAAAGWRWRLRLHLTYVRSVDGGTLHWQRCFKIHALLHVYNPWLRL